MERSRAAGKRSTFGAFFDSALDRIGEASIGLGLLLFYAWHNNAFGLILLYVVIIGSLMASYARARAEGLHIACGVGLMARPERVITLAIGLLLGVGLLPWVLALLAVATWGTVVQRIRHVWSETDGGSSRRKRPAPSSTGEIQH